MALFDKGFSQELAEVAKANDGNFEVVRLVELGSELGFVVVGLSSVNGCDLKGFRAEIENSWWVQTERNGIRKGIGERV